MPIAVITGAERGLGLETARLLLDRGYVVELAVHDHDEGRNMGELSAYERKGCVPLDLTDDRSIATAFAALGARYGVLDVLINNAGVTGTGSAVEVTRERPSR
ncbi:SDR family NAD(P)-dependent oxidoreductase [Streptomyces sp. NBC_00887]|uniref:SDR family NAD(P)-dependent oxidoreductase n=1 Tax=Streptomyces sp. NBC_00887 TaxID=2975859 RepID=UPI00386EC2A5|nr:SDR family NAD(P)-dependent oxidoreductase [Streptomyces sp. NBC_00887]WSY36349.1 SDR family NAD(P)-dependent oxidoreductase [Streptomyces sp. NBC_00887]